MLAAPVLFAAMKAIARHYRARRRRARAGARPASRCRRASTRVVLVSNLLAPTLRALAFAQATRPRRCARSRSPTTGADDPLAAEWEERGVPMPLVVIESPYRETVRPVRALRPPRCAASTRAT